MAHVGVIIIMWPRNICMKHNMQHHQIPIDTDTKVNIFLILASCHIYHNSNIPMPESRKQEQMILPSNGGTLDAGVTLDSTKLSFWATFSAT